MRRKILLAWLLPFCLIWQKEVIGLSVDNDSNIYSQKKLVYEMKVYLLKLPVGLSLGQASLEIKKVSKNIVQVIEKSESALIERVSKKRYTSSESLIDIKSRRPIIYRAYTPEGKIGYQLFFDHQSNFVTAKEKGKEEVREKVPPDNQDPASIVLYLLYCLNTQKVKEDIFLNVYYKGVNRVRFEIEKEKDGYKLKSQLKIQDLRPGRLEMQIKEGVIKEIKYSPSWHWIPITIKGSLKEDRKTN